ncbi:cellulase N-terminal Ig-like domain-containing protein, partial [Hyphomonas sp.]|uniref:cellulase N-terminal Ig-like domain-containing protein n=1 Tax=Hyphomonas sp. TaxID=87 RepID=UPI00391C9742
MSQHGVSPAGPLRAIVNSPSAAPIPYTLRGADGAILAEGRTEAFGADRASGERVHVIDITAVPPEGEGYVIEACGGA